MRPLTPHQQEILTFLAAFIAENGYAPSLEEIGRRFGLSSLGTVCKHLMNLQAKGFIKRSYGYARSIEIVPHGEPCPHCGQRMMLSAPVEPSR